MAGYGRIFNIASTSANYRCLLSNRNVLANTQPCATLKASALQKLGIPPKPKRPLTPFFKYLSNERVRVKQEDPSLGSQDVLKKVGKNWATIDPKEKEILQKAYEAELLAYTKQVMIYEQSITPEQKRMIRDSKEKKIDKEERYKLKKKTELLGRPKKPATSFIQFLQAKKYVKETDGTVSDWMRSMAEQWRNMSIEEKAKYQVEGQKLMQQYKDNMKEWENKMVRLGHIDVVRNRGLIDLKSSKME